MIIFLIIDPPWKSSCKHFG